MVSVEVSRILFAVLASRGLEGERGRGLGEPLARDQVSFSYRTFKLPAEVTGVIYKFNIPLSGFLDET
jgi:hypothetical protein